QICHSGEDYLPIKLVWLNMNQSGRIPSRPASRFQRRRMMAMTSGSLNGAQAPHIIIVPEADVDTADHWQARWEASRDNCHWLDLGMWDTPHRNTWVNKLNLAIYRADAPVVLVAHGFGCVTVAWWAEYEQPAEGRPVIGALLVAPPDVE